MRLKLTRSQKESGMISKSVVFMLDARSELTPEETAAVKKYKLGNQVIYNSEAAARHLDSAHGSLDSGTAGGLIGGMASMAMARMKLNISIDSLQKGHHIECKDLDELLGAEEAVRNACEMLKQYLEVAKSFDGSEEVLEY